MNKRNGTADLLKGFAVLCMIQVHLTEVFAVKDFYDSTLGHISLFLGGPFAAPLFMAVMGYFLYYSKKNLTEQIERAFFLFTGGILLNTGLNFHLLYLTFSGQMEHDPYKYILGADILTLAGLSVVIISVMKHYLKRSGSFILLLVLVLALTPVINKNFFINPYIQAFIGGNITWSYFPLFPWLSYPLAGYIFAYYMNDFTAKVNSKLIPVLVILLSAIITGAFVFAFPVTYDLFRYYHHEYLFALWTFGFLMLVVLISRWIDVKAGDIYLLKYIKWTGKNVTGFYIVQWLLIGNIGTYIYQTQSLPELIFWFFAITGCTSLVVFIYKKTTPSLSTLPTPSAEGQP